MDVQTGISVDRLADNLLRISVNSGQVMVDVQNQNPEHTLETRIGSTVITVRGTVFVAGVYEAGEAIVTVLEGSVYVNEVPLEAGFTMRVYDGVEMIYVIEPTVSGVDVFQIHRVVEVVEAVEENEEEEEITEPMVLSIYWNASLTPPIQQSYFSGNYRVANEYWEYQRHPSGREKMFRGEFSTTGNYFIRRHSIGIEITGADRMNRLDRYYGTRVTGFMRGPTAVIHQGIQISYTYNIELDGVQLNLNPSPRFGIGGFTIPLRGTLEALGMGEIYGNPNYEPHSATIHEVDGHRFVNAHQFAISLGANFSWDENTIYITIY